PGIFYPVGFDASYQGGIYRCIVAHASDTTNNTPLNRALWTVIFAPSPITVSAVASGTSINLSWTAVAGAPTYRVLSREVGNEAWTDPLASATLTSYAHRPRDTRSYQFAIQAGSLVS